MCFWKAKTQDVPWLGHGNASWSGPCPFPILAMWAGSKGKLMRLDNGSSIGDRTWERSHQFLLGAHNQSASLHCFRFCKLKTECFSCASYSFILCLLFLQLAVSDVCWTQLKKNVFMATNSLIRSPGVPVFYLFLGALMKLCK